MKVNIIFIIFALLTAGLAAEAQTLEGNVADAVSGEALSGVSAVAYSAGNRPIAYGRTDAGGKFSVIIPQGKEAVRITLKIMGYKTVDMPAKDLAANSLIYMYEEAFELNEVEVRPNKIRQSGDTLSYKVSAFRQKQDRSIADVIAKMPGMEVKPSGEILYQGKQINKFYIEGMDLLGSNYSIASENISADMVKDVQVYQDHQPIKVLKNVRFSDQAALNIVLKDEVKNVWQGTVDVGAGYSLQGESSFLRDARIIEMLFSRKKQSISMYKTNNSGKNIEREVADLATSEASLRPETSVVEDISIYSPSLPQHRFRFNDTHVVVSNWLFKNKAGDDIRLQLRGLVDKTGIENRSERTFIDTGDGGIVLTEEQDAAKYRNEWTAEHSYKANKDNVYFSNSLKAYADFNNSKGATLYNGAEVRQKTERGKRYVADDLEWIRSYKGNKSVSVSSHFIYDYLPATLLLYDESRQRLGQHRAEWNVSASFRHKLSGMYVTYIAGLSLKDQRLKIDNKDTVKAETYSQQYAFFIPSVSYKNPFLRISAALQMRLMHRNFNETDKSNILIEPNILMSYKLTGRWTTSIAYMQTWNPASHLQYIDVPIYTNYYSLTMGNAMMRNTIMHNLLHRWQYSDIVHGTFGNITLSYVKNKGRAIYDNSYNGYFYESRHTGLEADDVSYQAGGKIGKSIGWGKLSVAVNCSSLWNRYSLLIAQRVARLRQNTLSAGIDIAFHPISLMSLEANSSYRHSSRKQAENLVNPYSLGYFNHKFTIYCMPGDWQIELNSEVFHSNDNTISNCFFADLSAGYRKKTWEATVSFNNIFGLDGFERRYTSANQQIYSYTKLRPRELVMKVSFSL